MTDKEMLQTIKNVSFEKFGQSVCDRAFCSQIIDDLYERGLLIISIPHRGAVK